MMDSTSVITQATKGLAEDLAEDYDVSLTRMYEILGKDSPHPKEKKLIRAIARCDKSPDKWRVRIIKADFDSLFFRLLKDTVSGSDGVDCAELHLQLFEAIQAKLKGLPKAERLKEAREARAILDMEIESLEKEEIQKTYFTANGANGQKRGQTV